MTSRRALAVGALLLLMVLAGCSAAGSLSMQQATDETLAERMSRDVPETGSVVRRAIEDGSATVRGRAPPVESGRPFAHQGRYYDVEWSVIDRQPGTAVDIAVDYNGTAASDETVAYDALSARDRAVLADLLPPQTPRRTAGPDVGVTATYNATERDRSVLLSSEFEAVSYEGETYPIAVRATESVTIRTYRYTTSVVANDTATYARHLRADHLFTLSGLSADERAIVEEAIDGGYYAESEDDQAFRSVLDTVRQHEALEEGEYRGTWLVRYDGEIYLASLSYGEFVDE